MEKRENCAKIGVVSAIFCQTLWTPSAKQDSRSDSILSSPELSHLSGCRFLCKRSAERENGLFDCSLSTNSEKFGSQSSGLEDACLGERRERWVLFIGVDSSSSSENG